MKTLGEARQLVDCAVRTVLEMRANRAANAKIFDRKRKFPWIRRGTRKMVLEDIRRVPNVQQGQLTNGVKVP